MSSVLSSVLLEPVHVSSTDASYNCTKLGQYFEEAKIVVVLGNQGLEVLVWLFSYLFYA